MSSISPFGSSASGASSPGQDLLLQALKNAGLSSEALKTVKTDIDSVLQTQIGQTTRPDPSKIRDAVNTQLDSDVQSGKISSDDATAIKGALDKLDQQIKRNGGPNGQGGPGGPGGPPPGGPPPGGPPPGGGKGGSSQGQSGASSLASQIAALIQADGTDTNSSSSSTDDQSSSDSESSSQSTSKKLEDYLTKLFSQSFTSTVA